MKLEQLDLGSAVTIILNYKRKEFCAESLIGWVSLYYPKLKKGSSLVTSIFLVDYFPCYQFDYVIQHHIKETIGATLTHAYKFSCGKQRTFNRSRID
jgi:hypothetical protein